jgi:sec-independent protein translocase protein TatC
VSSIELAGKLPRDPDDDKTMTILEHLQELRTRLMIAGGALIIAMCLSFYPITGWVMDWLQEPAKSRDENFQLIFTSPLEGWTTYFQVSLLVGLTLSMPVILWQIMAFVGPGLTRDEKRWAIPIVLGASLMFVAGCLFAYYIEMPPAMSFLLDAPAGEPFISVGKYFNFITRVMFVTGVVFDTPLVIMGLAKVGVITSRRLLGWWRYVIVGSVVIAAIVTPSPDPVTCMIVAVPMMVLFFVGGLLARLVEANPIIPRASNETVAPWNPLPLIVFLIGVAAITVVALVVTGTI